MLLTRRLEIGRVERLINDGRIGPIFPRAHHCGGNVSRSGPHGDANRIWRGFHGFRNRRAHREGEGESALVNFDVWTISITLEKRCETGEPVYSSPSNQNW